jgi:hypothetical protein
MANAPALDPSTMMLGVSHPITAAYSAGWAAALAAIDTGSPWYAHAVGAAVTEYDDAIDLTVQMNDRTVSSDEDDHTYQVLVRVHKTLGLMMAYCLVTPAADRDMRWRECPMYDDTADLFINGSMPTKLHAAISFCMSAIGDDGYSVSQSTMQAFQDPDATMISMIIYGPWNTYPGGITSTELKHTDAVISRCGLIINYRWNVVAGTKNIYVSNDEGSTWPEYAATMTTASHWRKISQTYWGDDITLDAGIDAVWVKATVTGGSSTAMTLTYIATMLWSE